ncbi:MAG: hypothetical protein Q7T44_09645 [Parvibaculum sp.]|nr:hypothetical protein [Parvibaculum sp.]
MKKLPVLKSAREVYAGVATHFLELCRLTWLPLLIVISFQIFSVWADTGTEPLGEYSDRRIAQLTNHYGPTLAVLVLLVALCAPIMAVGFHRFVLLGEKRRGLFGSGFRFGRPELAYLWAGILVGIALSIPVGLSFVGASYGATLLLSAHVFDLSPSMERLLTGLTVGMSAVAFSGVFFARWMLLLPHVALGYPSSLKFIWQATRGNGLRLLAYFILVFVPIGALIATSYVATGLSPLASVLVGLPVYVVTLMLSITMLSVAYREIIGLPDSDTADDADGQGDTTPDATPTPTPA